MSTAEDFNRLAEEMADACKGRIMLQTTVKDEISTIKNDTAKFLRTFTKEYKEMTKQGTQQRENDSKKRKEDLGHLKQNVENLMKSFENSQNEMSGKLKADLNQFTADLNANENVRKKAGTADKQHRQADINQLKQDIANLMNTFEKSREQMNDAHKEMSDRLQSDLKIFMADLNNSNAQRKAAMQDLIGTIRADIGNMSAAWRNLLDTMKEARNGGYKAWAAESVEAPPIFKKTYQKFEVETDAMEADDHDARFESEADFQEEDLAALNEDYPHLKDEIISLLNSETGGMKMVQIAETLSIGQWRSLIPIMRQLLDDDQVIKEGSVYFPK